MDVVESFNWGAFLSSLLFGLVVGAFYGYPFNEHGPPRFPFSLYLVGTSFILMLAIWAEFSGEFSWEFQGQRALAWLVLCTGMPIGRWARMKFEEARIHKRYGSLVRRRRQ